MSLNQDYEDELFRYAEDLEDAVREAFDNGIKMKQSMLTNRSIYDEIKKEYEILHQLNDDLYYGRIVKPDVFRELLDEILGKSDNDVYVELYKRAYEDEWYGGMQTMLFNIAYAVAEDLDIVLPEQLKLVLKDAIRNYLMQNPGSTQYVLEKLNELKNAEEDYEFARVLEELGVPKDVADLLADAIWEVGSFYSVNETSSYDLDLFNESITDATSEVEQSVKEGNI